jgi:hypothetical protein
MTSATRRNPSGCFKLVVRLVSDGIPFCFVILVVNDPVIERMVFSSSFEFLLTKHLWVEGSNCRALACPAL